MFEKEAEERLPKAKINYCNSFQCKLDEVPAIEMVRFGSGYTKGFTDGAEFGYNKANEWHDLEKNPNDLPSKGRLVICYLKEDVFDVGIFKKEIELQCGKERIRKWAYFELPEELK